MNLGVPARNARGLTGAPPSYRLPINSWPETPLPPIDPDLMPPPPLNPDKNPLLSRYGRDFGSLFELDIIHVLCSSPETFVLRSSFMFIIRIRSLMFGFPPETELNPSAARCWERIRSRIEKSQKEWEIRNSSMIKFFPERRISGKFEFEFPLRGSEKKKGSPRRSKKEKSPTEATAGP